MSNLSYRVYSSYKGWNLLGIKQEVENTIPLIEDKIYQEKAQYIIIEHNKELNMDFPYKSIANEEEFIEFKREYKGKVKELKR